MTQAATDPFLPVRIDTRPSYWTVYGAIALTIFGINLFTDPTRYADFDAYIYYLDGLVHFPSHSWMYFEVFSNIYLLSAHWLARSVLSGMILAHYGLGIIFLLLLATTFPPRRSSWAGLLFLFTILGPLLAFVTMRATPAYFLVAIGVLQAIDRRPSAWLFLAAASLFHISSLLAALPMAVLYFERYLPPLFRANRSRRFYVLATIGIIAFGAVLPQVSSSVTSLIQSIPVISKYDAYTNTIMDETRIGHYLFLVFVTTLTIGFMTVRDQTSSRLNVFVMVSFALYVVMFFSASPVAAFRQTPFWIMPMIAVMPWDRLGLNRATALLFSVACIGLFAFQFQQVYV